MTTLYRPVLIESAEQAEALPIGTIAILRDGTRIRQTLTRTGNRLGPWEMDMRGYRHALVVGFTALVPIEAEEEYVAPDAITYSRYVTAWEEA